MIVWTIFKLAVFLLLYGMIDDQPTRTLLLGLFVGTHVGWHWGMLRFNRLLAPAGITIHNGTELEVDRTELEELLDGLRQIPLEEEVRPHEGGDDGQR